MSEPIVKGDGWSVRPKQLLQFDGTGAVYLPGYGFAHTHAAVTGTTLIELRMRLRSLAKAALEAAEALEKQNG